MALNDPTMSVPTPTGILQGVAAFNWDGSIWQPSGRAGPSVPTPTGVLQGVAAFSGVPPQPAGRAGPGVATPTGVLDGVAVYTWSGSQWTPPGGSPAPSTPSGALRGVAAFDWDGSAWQPVGQAGPDVATPYGVLQGVARFNWTGSAWAAVGASTFQVDLLSGSLGAGAVFTRASTGTYYNSSGTLVSAVNDTPRFDYDPATLQLKGLLLEDTSTNLWLQSANASDAAWLKASGGGPAVPVATANQIIAPDGTLTAASIVYPAVSVASSFSAVYQSMTTAAGPCVFSVWLKGASGGEQLYLAFFNAGAPRVTLTTQWQRFTYIATAPAGSSSFLIGTDLRGAGNTSTLAQTIYAWGAQVEQGYQTSYIPTTATAVTRAADALSYPIASVTGFDQTKGTISVESIYLGQPSGGFGALVALGGSVPAGTFIEQYIQQGANAMVAYSKNADILICSVGAFLPVVPGVISRSANTYTATEMFIALNGSVSASGAVTGSLPAMTQLMPMPYGVNYQGQMSGWMRRVRYWPRQLSQSELISVTS
jgi:hypothetical protein